LTKTKTTRIVAVLIGILVVASGVIGTLRYEGICSLGAWEVWTACPLGFLERSLAAREIMPQWPAVLLVVGVVIVLGRVFCAWLCPSVVLRRIFGKPEARPKVEANPQAKPSGINWSSYSPYAVLAGVLIASFLFGFPVFCLFCPIGL
jgi:ferredoxin-type protein NapH